MKSCDWFVQWTGMGNKELMEYFKEYNPVKPRHAYGPQGHRGMSLLIFGNSPAGYHDAEHLDKHFKDSRRGRDDWNRPSKLLFHPGGNRILYGYLAVREDLETFNRHSRGACFFLAEKDQFIFHLLLFCSAVVDLSCSVFVRCKQSGCQVRRVARDATSFTFPALH